MDHLLSKEIEMEKTVFEGGLPRPLGRLVVYRIWLFLRITHRLTSLSSHLPLNEGGSKEMDDGSSPGSASCAFGLSVTLKMLMLCNLAHHAGLLFL